MADSDRVQQITRDLEESYKSSQQAFQNISGLLSLGVATCDEVKAYNLWAFATYNAQRGLVDTIRAAGGNVPDAVPYPSFFAWQGISGEQAAQIDCTGQATSLSGAMNRALSGPDAQTVYLGLDKIQIVTTRQFDYNPNSSPNFDQLLAQQQQLGNPLLLLVIAGISIFIVYEIVSVLINYLQTSKLEESEIAIVKQQAAAFATYTAARLQCYNSCKSSGKTDDECVSTCQKLIGQPNIKIPCLPGQPGCDNSSWGLLQWVGFTVVAGVVVMIGWKLIERHREGKPIIPSLDELHLPEAHELPSHY